jgi:hypothetical protein
MCIVKGKKRGDYQTNPFDPPEKEARTIGSGFILVPKKQYYSHFSVLQYLIMDSSIRVAVIRGLPAMLHL